MKTTKQTTLLLVGALLVGVAFGLWLGEEDEGDAHNGDALQVAAGQATDWTCSMHLQIHRSRPGQCPICAMDLIPVAQAYEGESLGPRQLRLSPAARHLAAIQTAPVERRFAPVETRLVGKIAVDETRVSHITAWVPGRIDRLYVDYTGVRVEKGEHMAYLYSPELMAAQEELIQALRAWARMGGSGSASIGQSAQSMAASAREKLRLLGLTAVQVERIERERVVSEHLTIYAPVGGVVVEKHLSQGAYVQIGTPIYTIADFSRLWLELEAYESDLPWIHYGQEVEFAIEAHAGKVFKGRISFIDPVLDERTRTVRVRVNVDNASAALKPGMLVRAVVRAQVAADGRVMDPELAGKWISPMHPEMVRDVPGVCDICGMDLVRAEELGYISLDEGDGQMPLLVPAAALLLTGKRAVVYVAVAGKEGIFEGREVVLGPRAGAYYQVREGLREGDEVVVNGAFKIDSALQIHARPSMMNPQDGGSASGHEGHGHRASMSDAWKKPAEGVSISAVGIDSVFMAYFSVQQALSKDFLDGARSGAREFVHQIGVVDTTVLVFGARRQWMQIAARMRVDAGAVHAAATAEQARRAFAGLSTVLIETARDFGVGGDSVHLLHCPMAFDNAGADWLQRTEDPENPYFGSQMYRCGIRLKTFVAGVYGQ
ncbi:MAG: efflux RND transporter periplasmic adaptor subunit [Candidatus Latescibacterota bacterium]|nr:efflux RND transporter periplasmic adaptor subunit [Candidatus Latescibacterota bacterium]